MSGSSHLTTVLPVRPTTGLVTNFCTNPKNMISTPIAKPLPPVAARPSDFNFVKKLFCHQTAEFNHQLSQISWVFFCFEPVSIYLAARLRISQNSCWCCLFRLIFFFNLTTTIIFCFRLPDWLSGRPEFQLKNYPHSIPALRRTPQFPAPTVRIREAVEQSIRDSLRL